MRALVTAFDPFGGAAVNVSQQALALLPARAGGAELATAVLPTSFARAHPALAAAIAREAPELVLCTGQAEGRAALGVERVAINLQDARLPDNDGARPEERPVLAGGPAAYFSTLPAKAVLAALRAAGLPAEISYSAGTFVCNHVFYHLMRLAETSAHRWRAGFLHLPAPCAQLGAADAARGIALVIETALRPR